MGVSLLSLLLVAAVPVLNVFLMCLIGAALARKVGTHPHPPANNPTHAPFGLKKHNQDLSCRNLRMVSRKKEDKARTSGIHRHREVNIQGLLYLLDSGGGDLDLRGIKWSRRDREAVMNFLLPFK